MNERDPILPSMRVDGQVALVTGAGRGIGRGAALALAEAGAEVILVSRTAPEIESAAEIIRVKGGKAEAIACDVTRSDELRHLFEGRSRLDILVNNAGVSAPGPFVDLDEARLDAVVDLNIRAGTLVAQAGARLMVNQGSGVIINLSSTFGKVGRAGNAVYSASKHYIEGLTKSLGAELGPHGVRVVAVGPTAIITPLTEARLTDPEYAAHMIAKIPLGRLGQVPDVVGTIVFLASPAAALVNGVTFMVDGGWTAE